MVEVLVILDGAAERPGHGTDPETGEHLGEPVPSVCAGVGVPAGGPSRLVERLVTGQLEGAL
ncbi:MAG: hypothetical protein ACRDSN_05595 [Pseudonocardiaceae bacterium]